MAVLVGAAAVSIPRDTGARRGLPEASEDISDAECRHALDLIFDGRPRDAAEYIDSLEELYPRSPLYRLTRARVYREFLPIDDENKDVVKTLAEPIYADIDLAIDESTRRIDAGDDDPRLLLYRGWGWMFKSHIRTFERSFWSAGREAKRGQGDLLLYLEQYPDDPIANGIMGAFLYFADTLPGAYKFISKLLFMPVGDREEGLRLMVLSCSQPSLIELDNKTLLYSVYMAFEGRYEDGLSGFARLQRRHPNYAAFARPSAILLPFMPRQRGQATAVVDSALGAPARVPSFEARDASFVLLRFSRAAADRFYNPAAARAAFEALVDEAPEHPDWLVGFTRYELARMAASRGDYDGARKLLRRVLEDNRVVYLHGDARELLDALDAADTAAAPTEVAAAVADIYAGERARVEEIVQTLRSCEPPTIQSDFYLGEASLVLGDTQGATEAYRRVIAHPGQLWDEAFQLVACSRLAELMGSSLEYEEAARYLDMAPSFNHKEFLYDWFYEGRKRFYTRLANGEDHTLPSLFSTVR